MKKTLYLLMLFALTSCNNSKKPQLNSIVTLNGKVQSLNMASVAIVRVIEDIILNPQYDNFILFVHGRGKHPEKAFNKHIISDLEKDYSAKVIMFHWPSWEGTFAFPVQKARNASTDFLLLLRTIENYKNQNSNEVKNIKFTLLTNSMGSIVLEQAMLNYDGNIGKIFDTTVISASASLASKHSYWVNKINFSNDTYITINETDKLLGKLGMRYMGKRLGKGLTSYFGNPFEKANNVHYIELNELQNVHRYYLHRDLVDKPKARQFYDAVLNGMSVM